MEVRILTVEYDLFSSSFDKKMYILNVQKHPDYNNLECFFSTSQ